MAQSDRWIVRTADLLRDDANRQTQALAGMAVALFLVVVSLVLVRQMHAASAVEDCQMAARPNCDFVVSINH
jgi:type II secretory pathway component PulM